MDIMEFLIGLVLIARITYDKKIRCNYNLKYKFSHSIVLFELFDEDDDGCI